MEKPKVQHRTFFYKFLPWLIFAVALLARLYVLFFVTDWENAGPGWYGDVYHHWQIAYLTKEIGFNEGFLRLWDLRGLEYYWGLMHPLVLIAGFTIFNTSSVLVPRLVSTIFGAGVVAIVFMIMRRKFNLSTALSTALIFTVLPVTLFSDTIGMQEPLGLFLILWGIYLWPRRPGPMGFLFMLAGMVRSEYWIFGGLLILIILFRSKNTNHKITATLGYVVPLIFYMKYLLDYTGNPIYPVWTAYMATFIGEWFADVPVVGEKSVMQEISRYIFGGGLLALVAVIWLKPRGFLYWLLGIFNILIFAALHGIGAYVKGFEGKVLVDRLLAFPYAFLGSVLAVFLFYTLPKALGHYFKIVSWSIIVIVLIITQYMWKPIMGYHEKAKGGFESEIAFSNDVAKYYSGSGKIIVPYGRAVFIYGLIHKNKVPGDRMLSAFYDPFFYAAKGEDPFSKWEDFRPRIIKWYLDNDVSLMVAPKDGSTTNYLKMAEFETGKTMEVVFENAYYIIYKITVSADDAKTI
jgi:hypothetical protein